MPRYYETHFTPEELSGIDLFQDLNGNLWLKKLTSNPRLINWILWHAETRDSWCVPSQQLKTLGPMPHVFEFDTDELGTTYTKSFARPQKFKGALSHAGIYEVKLKLGQEGTRQRRGGGLGFSGAEAYYAHHLSPARRGPAEGGTRESGAETLEALGFLGRRPTMPPTLEGDPNNY